jgi:hypothetical protein
MRSQGGEKMTPVWAQRQEELLRDCSAVSDVFNHMVDRLGDFVVPYQQALETDGASPHHFDERPICCQINRGLTLLARRPARQFLPVL